MKAIPVEVYEPYKVGLPPLRKYWRSLWARRAFISEYSRSELHEKHFDSVFGQVWLVLNPLLLSGVYFLLIVIIGGHSDKVRYVHLTGCLFLFYFVANSMTAGSKSVVRGQKLILNTAFPRIMLPISVTYISFINFLPTILVFFVIRTAMGFPFGWALLWSIPVVLITGIFALGLSILISCANVYFRDISSFLPYFSRTWLYLSPILYEVSTLSPQLRSIEAFNPLFPMLDSWSRSIVHNEVPHLTSMLQGLAWALGILFIGTYFFLSRERDFAVRV
ncbi:MAG: ABC transporter permease [Candidatus Nanopelagicaceae bacterium]|nr:ABC transporter permease [Candidatus Nanopelagicaceae bacterium]